MFSAWRPLLHQGRTVFECSIEQERVCEQKKTKSGCAPQELYSCYGSATTTSIECNTAWQHRTDCVLFYWCIPSSLGGICLLQLCGGDWEHGSPLSRVWASRHSASTMVYPLFLGCVCVAPYVLSFVRAVIFFLSTVVCSGGGLKKKQQAFYYWPKKSFAASLQVIWLF